jgi:hypothetical protein
VPAEFAQYERKSAPPWGASTVTGQRVFCGDGLDLVVTSLLVDVAVALTLLAVLEKARYRDDEESVNT